MGSEGRETQETDWRLPMDMILRRMNLKEHCPDCGALLVSVPGGALCPHCGCEVEDPEERLFTPLARFRAGREEGARFQWMDDLPDEPLDEAA